MGSRITCTTCGKVWASRLDYMEDNVKCGKDTCPIRTASDKLKAQAKRDVEKLFERAEVPVIYSHEIKTDSVKSKNDPEKEGGLVYVETPKAIITEITRVKVVQ